MVGSSSFFPHVPMVARPVRLFGRVDVHCTLLLFKREPSTGRAKSLRRTNERQATAALAPTAGIENMMFITGLRLRRRRTAGKVVARNAMAKKRIPSLSKSLHKLERPGVMT